MEKITHGQYVCQGENTQIRQTFVLRANAPGDPTNGNTRGREVKIKVLDALC